MNGKAAKMLRRLKKDTKTGKKEFKSFNSKEHGVIREDYLQRGTLVQTEYSLAKRKKKREQISNC